MFDAEVRFVATRSSLTQKLVEELWLYAHALCRNGQIADDYSVSRQARRVRLLCILPERGSLEGMFHDKRSRALLRSIGKLITRPPTKSITGEAADTPPSCSCRRRSCLHLFTHMFDDSSPLACGNCSQPVPLYRLHRLDVRSREALLGWQSDYQACDRLFISSGFGEMWAYRQMSRLDSGLTMDGRELCAAVEAKVRVPVFYYLHKYWGRSNEMECKRLCPSCGKSWLLSEPIGIFDFKCDACRLLSSKAVDFPSNAN
ncbi:MAG: DUF2310 family Zn-ribbon-containing protein [Verrucomicrobiae bacterium]|nr:DUF2310 family Zn-ribbon-containing protein [Verrucomicrobiae bacterium]